MPADVNFCFPVPEKLENQRILLKPFDLVEHSAMWLNASLPFPEIYHGLSFGPFSSIAQQEKLLQQAIAADKARQLFVVFDKTREGTPIAGILGYLNSSTDNLLTEIGFVIILPPFHHTHVASNAVGLLMHYALDNVDDGGLGLRRLEWRANSLNHASVGLAKKMGFRLDAILRWDRVIPDRDNKLGNGRDADLERRPANAPGHGTIGRDTALLSVCWDEWEDTVRNIADAAMNR
ncbi:acyl-CoA N-acyltransferase [Fistulina hepatica ATCC 64428]|uniref:Acyl-CoA N-acyltransferase n=1 Tax=Fistulina hepatica ATCC 64428 TaxID=1128425 RepID=A0A0D7AH06_9AGAR|nr:acyl-CoA N-acyltransferase [Fistulina hepatica ATCC 64428]